jgi:transcription elongation GreA/GreB family factor
VALVRTDVSEELIASFIRVTRISELGTLAVTSNRHAAKKYQVRQEARIEFRIEDA